MKILAFVLTSCAASCLSAQEWDLFPLGQRSYLLDRTSWEGESVSMQLLDSVQNTGPHEILRFRSKIGVEVAAECSEVILAEPMPYYFPDPNTLDSLIRRNDTVFYHWWGSTVPFYFLPKVGVGESWTVTATYSGNDYQQITITCASIAEETFMGVTDSVKTFTMAANGSSFGQTPVSDFTMRLSKTHGLLEYIPFILFLYHPPNVDFETIELLGFENDGVEHGFRPPRFEDYFHPHVGDVLLWEDHFVPPSFIDPSWTRYHLDTVTIVDQTTDSVVIHFDRVTQHPDMDTTHSPGLIWVIRRTEFGALVESPPNWVAASNFVLENTALPMHPGATLWQSDALHLAGDMPTDTIVEFRLRTDATVIDTVFCDVIGITDSGNSIHVDTRAGILQICSYFNMGYRCFTLIGSLVAGDQDGSIILSAHVPETSSNTTLQLFPNPANDQLAVRGISTANAAYEVFDAMGMLIEQGRLQNRTIPVSDLRQGMYLLRVHTNEGVRCGRFMKN